MSDVTVFCSASNDIDPIFFEFTVKLAKLLADKEYDLVYGGDSVGLMGSLSKNLKENGRKLCGICVNKMFETGRYADYCDEVIIVNNLNERKTEMINRSEIILVLPGGIGTLNEMLDVFVMKHLKLISKKKIILLNVDGFFTRFLELLLYLKQKKFMKDNLDEMFLLANSIEDLEKMI